MSLTVDRLRQWEPAALAGPVAALRSAAEQLDDVAASLQAVTAALHWESAAGEAAQARSHQLLSSLAAVAAALRLQGEALSRAHRALEAAQLLLLRAQQLAADHGLRVLPDGAVTRPLPVLTAADPAPELARALAARQRAAHEAQRRAEALAREALASATECDADAARALASVSALLGQDAVADVDARAVPAAGTDPHTVAAWWDSLPPQVRRSLQRTRPADLGGLDGLPARVRNAANRARLQPERAALQASSTRLAPDDPAVEQVRDKLASLDALERVLTLPERRLLHLDLTGERATAVVAVGNVDTAAHVAVLVPGMSTAVHRNLVDYDARMASLRRQAGALAGGRGTASVATVSWLGYQAPQAGSDLVRPSRSVAHDAAARRGAVQLSAFHAGLDAARSTPVHLTALGHSYGSLVTGHALGPGTPVDDAVVFGSPGIGTARVSDLGLPPGQVHVVEARNDGVADLGVFGGDPNRLDGVVGLSARAGVVDGRLLAESTGHSSYLVPGTTSQYGIAAVVAGQAHRAPRDDGIGLGDWLQAPPTQWPP